MTLCVDLDAVEASTSPAGALAAGAPAGAEPAAAQPAATLPVRPLLGLAGSGVFAVWTSLTCFVC